MVARTYGMQIIKLYNNLKRHKNINTFWKHNKCHMAEGVSCHTVGKLLHESRTI